MSYWTQVKGKIELEVMNKTATVDKVEDDIRNILGREVSFEDDEEVWKDTMIHPDKYLLMGSEGSLSVNIEHRQEELGHVIYSIYLGGSLRDFAFEDKAIEWFKDKVDALGKMYHSSKKSATVVKACVAADGLDFDVWSYQKP